MTRESLGIVTGGSFADGLAVRLDEAISPEALRIGDFVVVEGDENLYFSMLRDLRLDSTDPRLVSAPPALTPFARRVLRGTGTYAVAEVQPMLMVPREAQPTATTPGVGPVRTIPMHFARLVRAGEFDFTTVFGREEAKGSHFHIGMPLTMDVPIPIDLARLVERSSGVFGSTGTGKSFLTRLLLAGIIQRRVAVTLVFDMHNEYAFGKQSEEGERVRGLRELFGTKVVVYSLDASNRRADRHLRLNIDEIEIGDVLSLGGELGLSESTIEPNLELLARNLKKGWLRKFTAMTPDELDDFSRESGGHAGSLGALHRRLVRLAERDYVSTDTERDPFKEMVQVLDRGKHVILHYGRHDTSLDQILVANMVTRRIRELYRARTEKFQESHDPADRPRPLVITVEEAHRFLSPEMARHTIFGTIARELRKYAVTLLIVDQRPSGIDDEILSQVGTRISGKLLDARDLEAVLAGVSNRATIRAGLASLDSKQQVMLYGHAVPMPVALRSRRYDHEFYRAVGGDARAEPTPAAEPGDGSTGSFEEEIDQLFGPGGG